MKRVQTKKNKKLQKLHQFKLLTLFLYQIISSNKQIENSKHVSKFKVRKQSNVII